MPSAAKRRRVMPVPARGGAAAVPREEDAAGELLPATPECLERLGPARLEAVRAIWQRGTREQATVRRSLSPAEVDLLEETFAEAAAARPGDSECAALWTRRMMWIHAVGLPRLSARVLAHCRGRRPEAEAQFLRLARAVTVFGCAREAQRLRPLERPGEVPLDLRRGELTQIAHDALVDDGADAAPAEARPPVHHVFEALLARPLRDDAETGPGHSNRRRLFASWEASGGDPIAAMRRLHAPAQPAPCLQYHHLAWSGDCAFFNLFALQDYDLSGCWDAALPRVPRADWQRAQVSVLLNKLVDCVARAASDAARTD